MPFKHVQVDFRTDDRGDPRMRKQDVLGLELATLQALNGEEIPLVVTSETREITVSWWHAPTGPATFHRWRSFRIRHRRLDNQEDRPGASGDFSTRNYSDRVNVVVTPPDQDARQMIFLVFKRFYEYTDPPPARRLRPFLVRLVWDGNLRQLTRRDVEPVILPIHNDDRRQGYCMWADYHAPTRRLLILSQVYTAGEEEQMVGEPDLLLAAAELQDLLTNPESENSWRFIRIGGEDSPAGGYHLSARLEGDRLGLLWSRFGYGLLIRDSRIDGGDIGNQALNLSDLETVETEIDLNMQIRDANTFETLLDRTDVPGGFSPRLHRLDPMYVTCDRVTGGRLISPFDPTLSARIPRFSSLNCSKRLIREMGNGTFDDVEITSVDATIFPRYVGRESNQVWVRAVGPTLRIGMVHPLLPAELMDIRTPPRENETVDLLHHSVEDGAVVHRQLELGLSGGNLQVLENRSQILDISHRNLGPELDSRQFEPFAAGFSPAAGPDPFTYRMDNTLGGLITADPHNPGLSRYAYSSLGDGGCRVVWHEDLPGVPPVDVTGKYPALPPEIVTGSHHPGEVWVDIGHAEGETIYPYVPGFNATPESIFNQTLRLARSSTVGCGFSLKLGTLYGLYRQNELDPAVGTDLISDDGTTLSLTEQSLLDNFQSNAFIPDAEAEDRATAIWSDFEEIADIVREIPFVPFIERVVVTLAKFRLSFQLDPAQNVERVEIRNLGAHDASIQFRESNRGQGSIRCSANVGFDLVGLTPSWPISELLTLDSVLLRFHLQGDFSPGVFMTDTRATDILGFGDGVNETTDNGPGFAPACITAKLLGPTELKIDPSRVDVSTRLFGIAKAALLIVALTALGLVAIAIGLGGLVAAVVAAATLPGIIASALGAWLALVAFFHMVFPHLARHAIQIAVNLALALKRDDIRQALERMHLLTYAGEGIAEGLARRVLEHPSVQEPLDVEGDEGRNRHRSNFWQTVFVTRNLCRVLIRR